MRNPAGLEEFVKERGSHAAISYGGAPSDARPRTPPARGNPLWGARLSKCSGSYQHSDRAVCGSQGRRPRTRPHHQDWDAICLRTDAMRSASPANWRFVTTHQPHETSVLGLGPDDSGYCVRLHLACYPPLCCGAYLTADRSTCVGLE